VWFPPKAGLFQLIDDGLARLVLGAAFAELDGRPAISLAFEEPDSGRRVNGDLKRVGDRRRSLSDDFLGEAAQVCGVGSRWFGDGCRFQRFDMS
jgi:hypothetical protein